MIRSRLASWPVAATLLLLATRGEAQQKSASLPSGVAPFEVASITAGSWYGRFGLTNCAWVDLGDGVLVVDTGGTAADAANLAKQIRETTSGKPVKWIVMTHGHADSNAGILDPKSESPFLPTDATIVVNARVAPVISSALSAKQKGKPVNVLGIDGKGVLVAGGRRFDLGTPAGSAHTESDLFVVDTTTGVGYVGDLVTPGRCPMMSDPNADPKGWLGALDKLSSLHAALLVPTRGDASKLPESDIGATRSYVNRVLEILGELKKKGLPEARVASELQIKKMGDYCPVQLDNFNAIQLYRRLDSRGNVQPATPAGAPSTPKRKS